MRFEVPVQVPSFSHISIQKRQLRIRLLDTEIKKNIYFIARYYLKKELYRLSKIAPKDAPASYINVWHRARVSSSHSHWTG